MMDIDKIRDEMAKNHDHDGVVMIGEYVSGRVMKGAKIPEGKTLLGAFEEIRKYASKHKTGNYAFVPPEKAYEIVDAYFQFGKDAPAQAMPAPVTPQAADDLDLDALLWG